MQLRMRAIYGSSGGIDEATRLAPTDSWRVMMPAVGGDAWNAASGRSQCSPQPDSLWR